MTLSGPRHAAEDSRRTHEERQQSLRVLSSEAGEGGQAVIVLEGSALSLFRPAKKVRGMAYLAAWRAWTRPAAYSVEFDCIVPLVVAFCAETEATATSAAVRKALIDMLAVVREERRKKRRGLNSRSCHRPQVGPRPRSFFIGRSSCKGHFFLSFLSGMSSMPSNRQSKPREPQAQPLRASTISPNKSLGKVVRSMLSRAPRSREAV